MNTLFDIYNLENNKQQANPKDEDFVIIGRSENPAMTGISSPIPGKSLKLVKLGDIASGQGVNLGSGAEVYKDKVAKDLRFRTLTSSDASVQITQNADEIDIKSPGTTFVSSWGYLTSSATQPTGGNTDEITEYDSLTTDGSISVSSSNTINVSQNGMYNVQFSFQIVKTSGGGSEDIYIYLKKNGSAIPDTATKLTLANNGHYAVAAWNFFVDLLTGENVQLAWYATAATVVLQADSTPVPGVVPAIPSVIVTINKVANI